MKTLLKIQPISTFAMFAHLWFCPGSPSPFDSPLVSNKTKVWVVIAFSFTLQIKSDERERERNFQHLIQAMLKEILVDRRGKSILHRYVPL